MSKAEGIKLDGCLGEAVARFFDNAVEAFIYNGVFHKVMVKQLLEETIAEGETLKCHLSLSILCADVEMLKENLKRTNAQVSLAVRKGRQNEEYGND